MSYVAFTEEQFNALDDFLTELAQGGQSTLVPKNITENGTYDPSDDDADGYSEVTVAVPIPVSTVEPLSVTQNGTYEPPTGVDGYAPVTVNVSGGGTSADPKDVNFIDYDGTIVYSYTKAEFLALTAMPENPTHEGLVSQGWNWSLADAQEYVAENGILVVGQMYATESGDTEIDIVLNKGRLSPYLGLAPNGTVTIDWGDGSTDTVTGTSTTTQVNTRHDYVSAGAYTIKVHVNSGTLSLFGSSYGSILGKNAINSLNNKVYANCIKAVRVGTDVAVDNHTFANCSNINYVTIPYGISEIGDYVFNSCPSLKSVTIPSSVTELGDYVFSSSSGMVSASIPNSVTTINDRVFNFCSALALITIPSRLTYIDQYFFSNCAGLTSLVVPSSVTDIRSYSISSCGGLGEIHFKRTTPPTITDSNAISGLPTDCKIYVPQGSLSAYTSARNYPNASTYTYMEE